MEISAESTKLITNSADCIQREVKVKSKITEYRNRLQILWSSLSEDGTKPEVLLKISQATATVIKLKSI